jgi:hypothetical protein
LELPWRTHAAEIHCNGVRCGGMQAGGADQRAHQTP